MEYFYNEIVVPKGYDPTYTFFNAGNFANGYFGIQNFNKSGKEERVAIFSVWSPQKTEDPKNVTEENKVKLVSKGTNVSVEPFGNEGTGLHAYVSYNWTTDVTYKFIVRGRPDPTDHTYSLYKAWFAPLNGTWLQIAEFRRPKSNGAYLGRALNFIENFETATGYLTRKALFGRQWARDGQGKWSEVTSTTFTSTEYNPVPRLDVQYGVTKVNSHEVFYMSTGGFRMTSDNPLPNAELKRQAGTAQPDIDLNKLP